MKQSFLALSLFLLSMTLTPCQESLFSAEDRTVPPAPVVSALTATVEGNQVTLSWIPAPLLAGENIILRSNHPITGGNFTEATVAGKVTYEETTFVDTIDNGQEYYYAILSKDGDGTAYEFFLPASNALIVGISTKLPAEKAEESGVQAFAAIAKNDTAVLSWYSGNRGKNLVLYRSTAPFTSSGSLMQAVVVASFVDLNNSYTDYPVPGVPNYYALLDEEELLKGTVAIKAGVNTNLIPVEIPSRAGSLLKSALPALRPMPLPLLNISPEQTVEAVRFSPATERRIAALAKAPITEATPKSPYVFTSDLEPAASGEEYSLRLIIDGSFRSRDWEAAKKELNAFLSIRRSSLSTGKAHFYLGQAEYFSGRYTEALLEFLLSRDQFENQSREWIQYSLDGLNGSF